MHALLASTQLTEHHWSHCAGAAGTTHVGMLQAASGLPHLSPPPSPPSVRTMLNLSSSSVSYSSDSCQVPLWRQLSPAHSAEQPQRPPVTAAPVTPSSVACEAASSGTWLLAPSAAAAAACCFCLAARRSASAAVFRLMCRHDVSGSGSPPAAPATRSCGRNRMFGSQWGALTRRVQCNRAVGQLLCGGAWTSVKPTI